MKKVKNMNYNWKMSIKNLTATALLFCSTVAYCNQPLKTQQKMDKQPYYVIDFNAVNCLINICVNDVPVFSMEVKGQMATTIPVNQAILASGEQQVSYRILPLSDESALSSNAIFEASVWLYYDWIDNWYDKKEEISTLFALPENKTDTPLPMYQGENSFFAEVPYTLNAWQNSQDLNKIDNLRKLVNATYRKIENLINTGQYEKFAAMVQKREDNIAVCFYLSEEEKNKRQTDLIKEIETGFKIVPVSEEDTMFIYGYGKLVSLKKSDGSSALLLYNEDTDEELTLEIRLHLEQGKTELSII